MMSGNTLLEMFGDIEFTQIKMRNHFRLPFLEIARKTMEAIESYEIILLRARLHGELKFLSIYQAKSCCDYMMNFSPGANRKFAWEIYGDAKTNSIRMLTFLFQHGVKFLFD